MKVSVCIGSCTVKDGGKVLISFITTDPVTLNEGCEEVGYESEQPFKIHLHTMFAHNASFQNYYHPFGWERMFECYRFLVGRTCTSGIVERND